MARVLPNSKLNRRRLDADQAYNRAVNRGDVKDNLMEVEDQPEQNTDQRYAGNRTQDHGGQG